VSVNRPLLANNSVLINTYVLSVLNDESANSQGDLYIRSVCFSPDGKYLATGAEDKLIRVRVASLVCPPA
jgi:WD40 repeat protein